MIGVLCISILRLKLVLSNLFRPVQKSKLFGVLWHSTNVILEITKQLASMERSPPGGWKVLFKNSLFYARRPMVSVLLYPGGIYLHVWQQLYNMRLVPWGCDTFWSGGSTRGTNVASYRGWCEKITKELGTRKKERLKRTWEKNAFLIFLATRYSRSSTLPFK